LRRATQASTPASFRWRMWGYMVTKVLHPRRCWEQRVILFLVVWRVLTMEVRLGRGGVLFCFLAFLFHALEICVSLFKKQLCPLLLLFINFSFYYFDYYLFYFNTFWSLDFFFDFVLKYFFWFDFCIQFGSFLFDLFFVFLYFFDIFFNFVLHNFIVFIF
jgi:hypothetical protein